MTLRPFAPCLRVVALCLSLLTLAACDSDDPNEERVGVSGRWAGDLVSVNPADSTDVTRLPVQMTLQDDVSRVTGFGSIQLPDETLQFSIPSGLFAPPSLSLTLIFDRPPLGAISGNVSSERDFIRASLTGPGIASGLVDFTLVMQRVE